MALTLTQIRTLHEEHGGLFFDERSIDFFNSAIYATIYEGNHFITGERMETSLPERYTVRRYNEETHQIDTIGQFREFADIYAARRRARALGELHGVAV